jgi:hypothetical protein
MVWQSNLFNNLLVVFILTALAVIVYCSVKKVTLLELFKDIKEILTPTEVIQ